MCVKGCVSPALPRRFGRECPGHAKRSWAQRRPSSCLGFREQHRIAAASTCSIMAERGWVGSGVLLVLLGQLVSLANTAASVLSKVLVDRGIEVPIGQIFFFYFTLAVAVTMVRPLQRCHSSWTSGALRDDMPFWPFWVAAFFDIGGNFAMLLAIRFTALTSVLLLGTGGVLPFVLLLGTRFLNHIYRLAHVGAVLLSLVGYVLIVFADVTSPAELITGADPVLGDLLCALSAFSFACSSIGQEALLSRGATPGLLLARMQPAAAVLALGLLVSAGHSELAELARLIVSPFGAGMPFFGFTLALVAMYALAPILIGKGGAALYNVSLLTTNVYGAVWAVVQAGEQFSLLKAAGSVAVLLGLLLFTWAGDPGNAVNSSVIATTGNPSAATSVEVSSSAA